MKQVTFNTLAELDYKTIEAYRSLRTNLRFAGDDVKVVLFTSAKPDEGKSTVVFNLARSLSDSGDKVLVIDTDMRKSVLMGRYRAYDPEGESLSGLSHFLSGQAPLSEVVYWCPQLPNMRIIFSGSSVLNATELLEKEHFAKLIEWARTKYEYVLIDCAPLGAVIDAAVVASSCDGAVIVASQKAVTSRMIVNVRKQLEATGVTILGAVMNKVKMSRGGRYSGYYTQYYDKYYTEDGEDPQKKKRKSATTKKTFQKIFQPEKREAEED